jgi:hypothetical protein
VAKFPEDGLKNKKYYFNGSPVEDTGGKILFLQFALVASATDSKWLLYSRCSKFDLADDRLIIAFIA